MKTIFEHTLKSYGRIAIIGCLVGLVTRLTDFFPNHDIWGFSSIATLFGFWMITSALIVYCSCSNINAGINTFLYLFFMSFIFYTSQPILGLYFPLFEGPFKTNLFILYTVGSFFSGICAFILYFWNRKNVFSNVLYALPVGLLASETIALLLYFLQNSQWLFQLLMDLMGVAVLGILFYKKAANKVIYIISFVLVTLAGYFFFYALFL